MDGTSLQDKISRGMGLAARKLGSPFIAYRPRGVVNPLSSRNRYLKLFASFNAEDDSYRRVSAYGSSVWWGVFDASYTQPGDYLVGASGTYFIAAQRPVLPVQCVSTNRVVSLLRASPGAAGGYGGMVRGDAIAVLSGWPASVLALGSRGAGGKPGDDRYGEWVVLLPALPVTPLLGDVLVDDQARNYAVASAELSDLGWRLVARQAAS